MEGILDKVHIIDDFIPPNYQNYIKKYLTNNYIWGTNNLSEYTSFNNRDHLNIFFENPNEIEKNVYEDLQFSNKPMADRVIRNHHAHPMLSILSFIQLYFDYSFNYNVFRIKANLQTRTTKKESNKYNTPHVDIFPHNMNNFLTILYYVNDSDGDTIIFNEKYEFDKKHKNLTINKRVSPKQGRVLMFPTSTYHAGNHPSDFSSRIVINYNIEISQN